MNNQEPVLQCIDVGKEYVDSVSSKVRVLQDVNFEILPGEQIAIMGRSGSGKTTLLQLMGGLDQPSEGRVIIQGKDIQQLSEKEKGNLRNQTLGFIYQLHHLLPEFTALENTMMPLLIGKATVAESKRRAIEALNRVGLAHRLYHRPAQLSGGERQRVAIARALIHLPACILADEPTGNLDADNTEQVFEMIRSLNRQYNISFIIVTHDRSLAEKLDRILILEHGRLIEEK